MPVIFIFLCLCGSHLEQTIIVILALLSCLDELNVTYQINYLNALVLVQVSVHLIPRHIVYNYPRKTSSSVGRKKGTEDQIREKKKGKLESDSNCFKIGNYANIY